LDRKRHFRKSEITSRTIGLAGNDFATGPRWQHR
jgi:hypothetical protein